MSVVVTATTMAWLGCLTRMDWVVALSSTRATPTRATSFPSSALFSSSSAVQFDDFGEGEVGLDGVVIDDLNWRIDKLRLEEENKRRFLKAKPRFLPYEECCKWVQAFGRWNSQEEWYVCACVEIQCDRGDHLRF